MWFSCVVAVALLIATSGCASIPKGMAHVNDVDVEGNDEIASSDIQEKIATSPTERFLGMFHGVYEYRLYDRGVLQRDLERVERYYEARGFYQAKARAGRVVYTDDDTVEISARSPSRTSMRSRTSIFATTASGLTPASTCKRTRSSRASGETPSISASSPRLVAISPSARR